MALTFLQACCVAVPLLLLAVTRAADEPEREEQGDGQPGRRANTWLPSWLAAACDATAAAATAAAAALQRQEQTAVELAALLWLATALTWLLIKAAAA